MDTEIDPSIQGLIKNDTLYIHTREDEFENLKTNKCLDKLQFLISLVCTDVSTTQGSKRIKHLRTQLKNILNVKEEYIECVDEYYKALRNRNKKPFKGSFEYSNFLKENFKFKETLLYDSETSKTLREEIFETPDTLSSFILSPNSWLYCRGRGSERGICRTSISNTEEKEKYYTRTTTKDSIITINYSNGLNVSFEIRLMDSMCDLLGVIRDSGLYKLTRILEKNSELMISELEENEYIDVSVIGDKYNLIREEFNIIKTDKKEKGFADCSIENVFKIRRYKPGPRTKSYESFTIDIKSPEFIGDLVL